MARNHSKNRWIPQEVEGVEIVDISEDGRGIGKKEGEVYFVRGGVPGEKLTLEVYGKKKSVKEASIARIEVPSPLRVTPFCQHFGECGGCKWQHMSYLGQLEFKEKQVRDALERIGKIDPALLSNVWKSIFPSSETQYYRNKLEFTFTHRRWKSIHEMGETRADTLEAFSPGLGFHVPGSFDKILDIEHCYLQKEPSNTIRNQVKEFCIQESIPFFELRSQAGLMRNLLIRTSNTDETMVIIVFAYEERSMISKVMNFVHDSNPALTSLQYIINSKKNDTLLDQEVILYKGIDFIREKMGDLVFRISAKSFYQTNSLQAYKLYEMASIMAGFKGHELVYDLYTGTGTIANFIASKVKKVIGLEYVEDAIKDAEKNAILNGNVNISFFTGDIKDLLSVDFTTKNGIPEVIITDPPRAGMHPDVVEAILKIAAPKLVYISCNPSTQARDIVRLSEIYDLITVQPVDMFPQTQHVENIILLQLRANSSQSP